jgi:uncharacterized phage protein gp47/JayE
MGATPVAYIDETGCHVPAFADVKAYFEGVFRGQYGADLNLDNATQDGQFIGVLAEALADVNAGILATWNSFDPANAVGVGLSRIVKQNGIARATPSFSTADVTLVGQAGTVIEAQSLIDDDSGNAWAVPRAVIPDSGQIVVTAVCTKAGAITAPPNTIRGIRAPSRGWQQAFNVEAATPGSPIERDAPLRRRQELSTAIPARGLTEATAGAILAISNVTRVMAYENDEDVVNPLGMPPHSVAFVVTGGDAAAIAEVIRRKKGGGATTYGTTTVTTYDAAGIPKPISFFRPVEVPVAFYLTLETAQGFTIDVQSAIATALATWVNTRGQGADLVRTRAIVPATFGGAFPSNTFKITDLQMSRDGQGPSPTDVAIAFYEQPTCTPESVQFYFPHAGG